MATLLNRRRYMGGGSPLPYDAEIEYLESTGTQWIDTKIVPSATCGIHIVFNPQQTGGTTVVCGSRTSGTDTRFWVNVSNKIAYGFGTFFESTITSAAGTLYDVDLNYKLNYRGICNGTSTAISGFKGNPYSIYVFCANVSGVPTFLSTSPAKVYDFKISDVQNIVFDAVPVRVGSTGYLYDKVSGQLFGNSGTGSFILGPDKT